MYHKIVNPNTGRLVKIDSKLGKQIINQYIVNLIGGHNGPCIINPTTSKCKKGDSSDSFDHEKCLLVNGRCKNKTLSTKTQKNKKSKAVSSRKTANTSKELDLSPYQFPTMGGLPKNYTRTIELWLLPSDLNIEVSPNKKSYKYDAYEYLGHMGFSFDHRSINDPEKKILGFGPSDLPLDFSDLFTGMIGGKISDDTDIFRKILLRNPSKFALIVRVAVTEEIFNHYSKIELYEYPIEAFVNNYGDTSFGFDNCMTYPIRILQPITFSGGGGIEETGYHKVPDFRGKLHQMIRFFIGEHETKKIQSDSDGILSEVL